MDGDWTVCGIHSYTARRTFITGATLDFNTNATMSCPQLRQHYHGEDTERFLRIVHAVPPPKYTCVTASVPTTVRNNSSYFVSQRLTSKLHWMRTHIPDRTRNQIEVNKCGSVTQIDKRRATLVEIIYLVSDTTGPVKYTHARVRTFVKFETCY